MKKNLSPSIITVLVLSLAFTSCKKKDNSIAVEEVTISPSEITIGLNDTMTLVATVLPDNATNRNVTWSSRTTYGSNVATVGETGMVTGLALGMATVTATTVSGNKLATGSITVAGCNNSSPGWGTSLGTVSFKTDSIWKIGEQEWSDVVMASNCNKTTFSAGSEFSFNADCRSNSDYGNLFSWCAVIRFQNELCPDNWRVPAENDFIALDIALGGNGYGGANLTHFDKYLDIWGGEYGGFVPSGSSVVQGHGTLGCYWSHSESDVTGGKMLILAAGGNGINTRAPSPKRFGSMLRCVR
jgi:uncharacterized protein (TIGR02145 family)